MLGQIMQTLVSLFFLGLLVILGVLFLNALTGLPLLWPTPRREEHSERVIIINNQPPAQPAGPSAASVLAPAVAGLLVALTRRVEPPTLPTPTGEPNDIHPARYYDHRG